MKFSPFSSQPDVGIFCPSVRLTVCLFKERRSLDLPSFFGKGEKHLTPALVAIHARTKSGTTKVLFEIGLCRRSVLTWLRLLAHEEKIKISILMILVNVEMMILQAIIFEAFKLCFNAMLQHF